MATPTFPAVPSGKKAPMYSRLKSSLLSHFKGGSSRENAPGGFAVDVRSGREGKEHLQRRSQNLRDSLAECRISLTTTSTTSAAPPPCCAFCRCHESVGGASSDGGGATTTTTEEDEPTPPARIALNPNYADHRLSTATRTSWLLPKEPDPRSARNSTTSAAFAFGDQFFALDASHQRQHSNFGRYDVDDDDDVFNSAMPHFAYSWNVKYVGSFPVSSTASEHVAQRLEKFSPSPLPQNVELSISILGVRISCEEVVVMAHSLRRVCSVVSRPQYLQVAYIGMEPTGRVYRKLCHVFQAHDVGQLEEVETVLQNAFQTAALSRPTSTATNCSRNSSQSFRQTILASTPALTTAGTMNEKRSSSSAILTKILGKKGSQTVDENSSKRKRRPVSAVFSSAIHRLSSSTAMSAKRMTTIDAKRDDEFVGMFPARISSPVPEEPLPTVKEQPPPPPPQPTATPRSALVFDEKLQEWCFPIDDVVRAQLEQCNYFVGLPTKESMVRNLLSQPEGAFVVRYSESKKRCLALSLRVPPTQNPSGISHYLILRNESGFRFYKGSQKHFASVQMLLTHHSVLQEHLPVQLHFVQWNKSDWQAARNVVVDEKQHIAHRHSTALTKIDENRNVIRRVDDFMTPKRRSRLYPQDYRRTKYFDIDA